MSFVFLLYILAAILLLTLFIFPFQDRVRALKCNSCTENNTCEYYKLKEMLRGEL